MHSSGTFTYTSGQTIGPILILEDGMDRLFSCKKPTSYAG